MSTTAAPDGRVRGGIQLRCAAQLGFLSSENFLRKAAKESSSLGMSCRLDAVRSWLDKAEKSWLAISSSAPFSCLGVPFLVLDVILARSF